MQKPTANDLETHGKPVKGKSPKEEALALIDRANKGKHKLEKLLHVPKFVNINGIPHKLNSENQFIPLKKVEVCKTES